MLAGVEKEFWTRKLSTHKRKLQEIVSRNNQIISVEKEAEKRCIKK